jgi:flagellar motor switch protein FliN/FliY
MTTENTIAEYQSFSNAFFAALLSTAAEATGSPWQRADVQTVDSTQDEIEPFQIQLSLDGSLHGEILLEMSRADAAILASRMLRVPVSAFGREQAEALLDLLTAAANAFRLEPGADYGTFSINASRSSEPSPDRANLIQMAAADGEGTRIAISMYLSATLAEELALQAHTRAAGEDLRKGLKANGGRENAEPVNLDLVLDVELNVTLRFGQRKLTLREVLELTSGSVVELDRQVEEPVELLLDGMVIARGEAVVVDGNYGLRVTEVSQSLSAAVPK